MSEPMSSVEIEDVLSSIRRLVSDDLRPQARTVREPAAQPAPAEKLVLTPALRIVPEPEPQPATAPEAVPADTYDEEPEFHSIRAAVEEARVIAVEDGDGAEAAAPADTARYDDEGMAAPEAVSDPIPDEVFAADRLPEDDAAAAEEGPSASTDWADEAEAAIRAELEQETVTEAYARFLDEPEEAALDEAAMRELVRDIIREELQGTLGERITRNVRKLVRAEIARALAVRDFD